MYYDIKLKTLNKSLHSSGLVKSRNVSFLGINKLRLIQNMVRPFLEMTLIPETGMVAPNWMYSKLQAEIVESKLIQRVKKNSSTIVFVNIQRILARTDCSEKSSWSLLTYVSYLIIKLEITVRTSIFL